MGEKYGDPEPEPLSDRSDPIPSWSEGKVSSADVHDDLDPPTRPLPVG